MNNRNREQEQRERERSERNRYSTSGYGSDEGDYGPAQYGRQGEQAGPRGSQRESKSRARDRDVQGDYSSGGWQPERGSQQGYGREGSYGQARGDRAQFGQQPYAAQRDRPQYGQGTERFGSPAAPSQHGAQGSSRYGSQAYASEYGAGSERFDPQDYPQGSSYYGTSDYERQSGYGSYGREGGSQPGRDYRASPGQWRAGATAGSSASGLSGGMGASTSYRGRGPKNYTRSDERIREDLNERLTDSDDVDASNIIVEVSNGVATLTGSVDERWMKHRAEDLAESCSGVRDVDNKIRVLPPGGAQAAPRASMSPGATSGGSTLGASAGSVSSASPASSAPGSSATGKTGGSSTHN